ncbi:MAG: hypothetical protein Q9187_008103, partial [Circinaria calcarea]
NKLDLLSRLKATIKHQHVPEVAIPASFDVVRIAISSSDLLDAGFSILSHLTKRLILQDHHSILASQGNQTYSCIVDRLGDTRDRVRSRALQSLVDFWSVSPTDVEQVIRDIALASKVSKAKEAGMQWILKMNKEHGLHFRSFVPKIVECLADVDGSVRQTAETTTIELFEHTSDRAKSDLKRQLQQNDVQKSIVEYIYSQLGLSMPLEAELSSSTHSEKSEAPMKKTKVPMKKAEAPMKKAEASMKKAEVPMKKTEAPIKKIEAPNRTRASSTSTTAHSKAPTPVSSASESEADHLEPLNIHTSRELEDAFRDMAAHFEGKESEHNWTHREKSILKLRRITKGNSPYDFTTTYLVGIKALLEGILKTVNSLRTTLSNAGCLLVQDIATATKSGIDNMVEILLQSLIKLCGGTKTISAQNGKVTVNTIIANVTYSARLTQHIWNACQDKNVRPRTYATGWLRTLIRKHSHHKSVLEHANGLDLIEKCIKRGLNDPNPDVRKSMRPTYWAFSRVWSDRSDGIMASLDAKQQAQLLEHPSNPDPDKVPAPVAEKATTKVAPLKETIATRMKAKLAELKRPDSAQPSPARASTVAPRPATSMATSSKAMPSLSKSLPQTGTLSSAPVRPTRQTRKAPIPRKASSPKLDGKSPQPKADSSKPKADSPKPKVDSPKPKADSPKPKADSPKPKVDGPKPEANSSKPKLYNPKRKVDSPKDKVDYPKDKVDSPKSKVDSPNSKVDSPKDKVDSPDLTAKENVAPSVTLPRTADHIPVVSANDTSLSATGNKFSQAQSMVQDMGLRIFEDPGMLTLNVAKTRQAPRPTVLEEIPVNNYTFNGSKILQSGISRLQSGTLDILGFKKLQNFIKSDDVIWQDGSFDYLLLTLLVCLESPNSPMRGQLLLTIRMMLFEHRELFSTFYPRALCAFLYAHRFCTSSSHLACGLAEACEDIVVYTEYPEDCIDSILDLIETEPINEEGTRTISMG